MKLKLDENLGGRIPDLFRRADHEVSTVHSQGLEGIPDTSLIEVCRREGRCLVTLDLEFGNPLRFKPSSYHGIAVLRLPGRATPEHLQDAVETLIGGLEREEIEGRLWVVQRGRIRQYEEDGG